MTIEQMQSDNSRLAEELRAAIQNCRRLSAIIRQLGAELELQRRRRPARAPEAQAA